MSKNPEEYSMRGESRVMTVLFSDVRDFTSISEGLTPEGLKDMMNAYLTAMTEVIQQARGTIDKYIGDAIMSCWGAPLADPDHTVHATEAALAMQKRIRALDDDFVKRGWPLLHIGVGLNCGEMNVGDMGSRFRRAYTVMGHAVNLASRLEGLTKEYGIGILGSEHIAKAPQDFVYRALDRINLWLLEDGDGWTLVDTGFGVQATWDLWEMHFAGALAGKPVKNIVVTHYHPDHVGSAAWLVERTGAPFWMTAAEYLSAHAAHDDFGGFDAEKTIELFVRNGLAPGAVPARTGQGKGYARGR